MQRRAPPSLGADSDLESEYSEPRSGRVAATAHSHSASGIDYCRASASDGTCARCVKHGAAGLLFRRQPPPRVAVARSRTAGGMCHWSGPIAMSAHHVSHDGRRLVT